MNETAQSSTFGMFSVAFGFLAFTAIVGHFFAGPFEPPPPIEMSVAETAVNIRDATLAALKGEEYESKSATRSRTLDDYLTYSFVALASLAILMAVIGFIRHEKPRPAIAGAAFGGMAIAFQVTMMLFFAMLFVFLVSAVLDKLDFGFDFS